MWKKTFLLAGGLILTSCAFKLPNASIGTTDKEASRKEFAEFYKLPEVPVFDGDLFMIFSHADDELLTLSYAAKLKKNYPDKAIHWILVSDSGKGLIIPTACGVKNAIECRSNEAQKAAQCIGIDKPYEMRLPDGKIAEVKDLKSKLYTTIKKLTKKKVGAILTHDYTGVYGHSDHIAVHDALKELSQEHHWPMLTAGIPAKFRQHIKIRGKAAKGRKDTPVTHIINLDDGLKKQMVCAIEAHDSQKFLLWLMRKFMTTEGYLEHVPIQFYYLNDSTKQLTTKN